MTVIQVKTLRHNQILIFYPLFWGPLLEKVKANESGNYLETEAFPIGECEIRRWKGIT